MHVKEPHAKVCRCHGANQTRPDVVTYLYSSRVQQLFCKLSRHIYLMGADCSD